MSRVDACTSHLLSNRVIEGNETVREIVEEITGEDLRVAESFAYLRRVPVEVDEVNPAIFVEEFDFEVQENGRK
jgi:hypothetical protein